MNSMMTLDSMYMGVGLEALFSWYSFAIYIYILQNTSYPHLCRYLLIYNPICYLGGVCSIVVLHMFQ